MKTAISSALFILLILIIPEVFSQKEIGAYYVMAPSGLNMRSEASVSSSKIYKVPLGTAVKIIEPATNSMMEVEHITGGMAKVSVEGKEGFVFDGFLSRFPIPAKDVKINDYGELARTAIDNILVETINRDYGGYYQYEEVITFPGKEWAEAFYIARYLFGFPEGFSFPSMRSKSTEIITENPDKADYSWSDEMKLTYYPSGELASILHYQRGEASGKSIFIQYIEKEDHMRVSMLQIAD